MYCGRKRSASFETIENGMEILDDALKLESLAMNWFLRTYDGVFAGRISSDIGAQAIGLTMRVGNEDIAFIAREYNSDGEAKNKLTTLIPDLARRLKNAQGGTARVLCVTPQGKTDELIAFTDGLLNGSSMSFQSIDVVFVAKSHTCS